MGGSRILRRRWEEEVDRGVCEFDESGVKIMDQMKFDAEMRRIAVAFGSLPSCCEELKSFADDADLRRHYYLNKGHYYRLTIGELDFEVAVSFDISFSIIKINIVDNEDWSNRLDIRGLPDKPRFFHEGNYSQYTQILARALYLLGFDISPIETEYNLNITAHEKLDWRLEFQRRLREETSQVE